MQLLGRLVADPEVRSTRNGKDFLRYTLATQDPLVQTEGESAPTTAPGEYPERSSSFHNIFVFGETQVQSSFNILGMMMSIGPGSVSVIVVERICFESWNALQKHQSKDLQLRCDPKILARPSPNMDGFANGTLDYPISVHESRLKRAIA